MTAAAPPRLGDAHWLARPETQAVFAALTAQGFAVRAVGGAVRNALIGRAVVDVDFATPATPDQVIAAAKAAGLEAVPTGIAHGTVTVISSRVPFEVTTLRRDVETFGRHATVAFTGDWAEDARRRDFTMNALYCDAAGQVFDPIGGYADVAARRVRFIASPTERIREDYLRILRFFRLNAEFGEGPADAEGLAACVRERSGIARLSAERVRQELLRLLVAPRAVDVVHTMLEHGLLPLVLGAAPRPNLLGRLARLEAALGCAPDAILRLAALAAETPDDADQLRARLRLSNDEHDRLARAAGPSPDLGPATPDPASRAYLYAEGADAYRARVLTGWARSGERPDNADWRARLTLPERWSAPRFPLTGADVMALGIPAGPRVGEMLRALEAWWIAGDFAANEAALRAELAQRART